MSLFHLRPGTLGAVKRPTKEALAERRKNDRAARPALDPLPMSPGQAARRERLRQIARERVERRKRERRA